MLQLLHVNPIAGSFTKFWINHGMDLQDVDQEKKKKTKHIKSFKQQLLRISKLSIFLFVTFFTVVDIMTY